MKHYIKLKLLVAVLLCCGHVQAHAQQRRDPFQAPAHKHAQAPKQPQKVAGTILIPPLVWSRVKATRSCENRGPITMECIFDDMLLTITVEQRHRDDERLLPSPMPMPLDGERRSENETSPV